MGSQSAPERPPERSRYLQPQFPSVNRRRDWGRVSAPKHELSVLLPHFAGVEEVSGSFYIAALL